jgi:hypothetical protein
MHLQPAIGTPGNNVGKGTPRSIQNCQPQEESLEIITAVSWLTARSLTFVNK